jgi:hypothetical protein
VTELDTLVAKDRITSCLHQLFISTDNRDWVAVRACLDDTVRFDMTSLAGGTPVDLTPQQITDAWEAALKPIDHVHHQAGNLEIQVLGDRATAFCYGIALHHRPVASGNNIRRFVGSYDFELRAIDRGWVISLFRFNAKFVDGNLELEKVP